MKNKIINVIINIGLFITLCIVTSFKISTYKLLNNELLQLKEAAPNLNQDLFVVTSIVVFFALTILIQSGVLYDVAIYFNEDDEKIELINFITATLLGLITTTLFSSLYLFQHEIILTLVNSIINVFVTCIYLIFKVHKKIVIIKSGFTYFILSMTILIVKFVIEKTA